MYIFILSVIYCILPLAVNGVPVFNQVNGYDIYGKQCPLATYNAYPCPTLCVTDIQVCPESIRPTCSNPNQVYCMDGQCHEGPTCPTNLISACSCSSSNAFTEPVYPCQPFHVKITNFIIENKQTLATNSCTSFITSQNNNNVTTIQPWNTRPTLNEPMWGDCPAKVYPPLTYTEPVFIALYTFYGSCFLVLIFWWLYKSVRESVIKKNHNENKSNLIETMNDKSNLKKNMKIEQDSIPGNEDVDVVVEEDMIIKAYKRDIIGNIVGLIFIIQTIGHIGFMIMMTKDYYMDFALFGGDFIVESSAFIGMWYIFFGWYASLTIFRFRLPNFFRIQCNYGEGQYVQVEKKQEALILLEGQSNIVMDTVRQIEATITRLFGIDVNVTNCKLQKTRNGTSYFVYQCTRYVYQVESGLFVPHIFELGETCSELAQLTNGLTEEEASFREELIGPNFIQVYVPNFFLALFREFASFFYIYQFTILWLFYYFAYWQVGIADTCVILASAFVKVFVRLRSEKRIKKMAEFTDTVSIFRDGEWKMKSTAELLPGDLFEIVEGNSVPCDAIILSGNIVVDESSLTGEPLPIRKFPLRADDHNVYQRMGANKISTIFAGTTISQAQPTVVSTSSSSSSPLHHRAVALVTQTGTATDKGELIKKILFPTKVSFIFDEQLKIVIVILLCCSVICLGVAIWLYAKGTSAWFYIMFAISQLVSPLLPAALVVGQSITAGRLRDKHIYCVDLPRILMAGKVQIFCFDKTGTLTKEGLEFFSVQPIRHVNNITENRKNNVMPEFDQQINKVEDSPRLAQIAVATCHSVTLLNDQYIGNPVDVECMKSSGWELQKNENRSDQEEYIDTFLPPRLSNENEKERHAIHVLKRFEFVHARMSMSVAVLDTKTNKIHIFVKGAYEKIKDLSDPVSIPDNYDTVTSDHARHGCYVLALAHREIDLDQIENGLDGFKQWNRDQMEQDIHFMGLIIFKNQLKSDTTENIQELKRGATRTVMITGDTALTGVYIARQCGMTIQSNTKVLLGDYDKKVDRVVWIDVDEPDLFHDVNVDEYLLNQQHTPVELAVTGKAFDWLVNHDLIRKYLLDIRVFARMTPSGKVQCVQLHMERGITAMTGDGGNDCGALRAAHVGIAMSDAEASIVSPFSTSIRSVKSCVELVRQGRAALATSITGYKYLILYGQVMMMLKIFTFYFSISMSQNIWIAVDVFITVLLTWAVSLSKAEENLAVQRPTAKLLGPQVLASTMGVVLINWLYLISGYVLLFKQQWFRCNEFDSKAVDMYRWWLLADSYEAEILTFICLFQFINNAAVQNFGYKFRQAFYKNYFLVFLWLLYIAIASYWLLADPNIFGCMFRFNCGTKEVLNEIGYPLPNLNTEAYNTPLGHNVFPQDFRYKLWGLILGNMATALVWERFVVLGPVHEYLAKKFPVDRLKITY
ncbi:hypothetical protein BJ944DRAFT_48949 [Cunninghamella echinulata]|nr:hypothetical protein BJ944DRAFT_48949 [Cunninghamella echinulata]